MRTECRTEARSESRKAASGCFYACYVREHEHENSMAESGSAGIGVGSYGCEGCKARTEKMLPFLSKENNAVGGVCQNPNQPREAADFPGGGRLFEV